LKFTSSWLGQFCGRCAGAEQTEVCHPIEQKLGSSDASVTAGLEKGKEFHIPSLDGLRAISFLLVFASHAWWSRLGQFGVSIFFFLSGFLITTLLRIENDKFQTISLRNFYWRRVLRIFPPFYLTVLFILLLVAGHVVSGQIELKPILAATLYAGNYWAIFQGFHLPGFTPFWSLAVEEHFYLLFPLAFLLMCRAKFTYKRQAVILAAACACFLAWRLFLILVLQVVDENRILYATDTRVDTILFGCIFALALNPVLDKDIKPSFSLSILALGTLLLSVIFRGPVMHLGFKFTLQGLALIPLFTIAIMEPKYFKWLNWKWVRYVGTLSYTLYLVHLALFDAALAHIRAKSLAALVALALCFLYAYAMNRAVEIPAARLRKRFRQSADADSPEAGKYAAENVTGVVG
jgi:peptidoglycan/LPS O-acetylase OafA/YrhL